MTESQRPDTGRQRPDALRSFWLMFVVEFQNAFSDNVLRWLVTFLIVGMGLSLEKRDSLVPLVGAVFALPFVLFSMAGGFFADRYSKRSVAITVKCAELGIMSVASVGLWLDNIPLMLAGIFLMSTHSAIFGPTKYGMLPELLPEKKLSWGNGIFGLGTFSAAITGTIFAGMLSDVFGQRQILSGAILIALALVGLSLCLGIRRLPAADPHKKFRANFLGDFLLQFRAIRRDRVLFLGVVGNTFLSFLAMLLQLTVVFYGKDIFHFDDRHSGYLQGGMLVGVGAGSLAAGFLSGGKIEYGLIPLGMAGLTAFAALLSHAGFGVAAFTWSLGLLGFFGGLYNVPVNAIIQHRPDADKKGQVIATAALLSWVGILLASGVYYLLTVPLHLKPPQIFLFGAVLSLAGTIYCVRLMPDSLLRFVLWCATHSLYRIRVLGRDNIPEKGGALFVCNHASFVDALLLLASTDRQVRFMMFKGHYELPLPETLRQNPGRHPHFLRSTPARNDQIAANRQRGHSERRGRLHFCRGPNHPHRPPAAVPARFRAHHEGCRRADHSGGASTACGAASLASTRAVSSGNCRAVFRIPSPSIMANRCRPPRPRFEVRHAVQELLAEAWQAPQSAHESPAHRLHQNGAQSSVPFRHGRRPKSPGQLWRGAGAVRLSRAAAEENLGGPENGRSAAAAVRARRAGQSRGHAARQSARESNYTVSEETLASCVRQCDIKTVVTSRALLDKLKLKVPGETVFLEDVAAKPGFGEKLAASLMAWLAAGRWVERAAGRGTKDAAWTIWPRSFFPAAAPANPKGVMLSHYNIGSNIEQLEQVFGLNRRDCVLGILPFFHSFGFTGTLCLPAVLGVGVVFHPNPLDARAIGPLVREHNRHLPAGHADLSATLPARLCRRRISAACAW